MVCIKFLRHTLNCEMLLCLQTKTNVPILPCALTEFVRIIEADTSALVTLASWRQRT